MNIYVEIYSTYVTFYYAFRGLNIATMSFNLNGNYLLHFPSPTNVVYK